MGGSCFDSIDEVVEEMVSIVKTKVNKVKLIIAKSAGFCFGVKRAMEIAMEAAKKHPEVPFINVSGDHAWREGKDYKAPKNLSNFMGRMEYGKIIAGCVAALATKTGKIGYLGPLINDETRRLAASAYLGARYTWTNILKKTACLSVFVVSFLLGTGGCSHALKEMRIANNQFDKAFDTAIETGVALVISIVGIALKNTVKSSAFFFSRHHQWMHYLKTCNVVLFCWFQANCFKIIEQNFVCCFCRNTSVGCIFSIMHSNTS
jgi:hypothetical protein